MKLTNYTLILTDSCNLRCTYCFDDLYSGRTCSPNNMTIEMLPDLFDFIERTRDRNRRVIFNMFGGEPTLNWDIFEQFCEYANDHCEFDYEIITTTNGTLMDTKKIDFLKKHDVGTSVSLDGTKEANKERVTINKESTWTTIMHVLPEMKAKLRKLNIIITIGRHNYSLIEESYKMLMDIGLIPVLNWNSQLDYTKEEVDSIREQFETLFIKEQLPMKGNLSRATLDNYICNGTYCAPANVSIAISPIGKLYFCHQFVPKMAGDVEDMSYGNIKDGITNIELYNTFVERSSFSKDKSEMKCGNCPSLSTCKGGCLADHWHMTKSFTGINSNVCKISEIIDSIAKRRK